MHPQIEDYLAHLRIQLKGLSPQQRSEEIREIGQHLQGMVEEERERGLSEAEAVRAALLQFGPSRKVGRDLNKAVLKPAPSRLSKSFSIMTKVMIGQTILNLLAYGLLLLPLSLTTVIQSVGGEAKFFCFFIVPATLYSAVSIWLGVLLRRLRPGAFWPALALMSYQSICYGIQTFSTLFTAFFAPSSATTGPRFSTGTLFFLPTLFCLVVLILNRKIYFRLASAKHST